MKMWDARTSRNVATAFVNAKVFCQDVTGGQQYPNFIDQQNQQNHNGSAATICVAGGSDKKLHIFDYRMSSNTFSLHQGGLQKLESRESTLKFQLRCLAISPNKDAFVHASVEGRASWDFINQQPSNDLKKSFAFKCHRTPASESSGGKELVHSVNDVAFHPVWGTFATVGGDGTLCMWDGAVKKRIWRTSKFDNEISALTFSPDGKLVAMAVSDAQAHPPNEIWIKTLQDSEVMPRKK